MRWTSGTPHDRLFRAIIRIPGLGAELIRNGLPGYARDLIADLPIEPLQDSFFDEELRLHQCDGLFRVVFPNENRPAIYFLLEHKSAPDRKITLVLARKPRNMLIIREDMSICTYEDSWNLLRLGQIRSHNGGFRQIFESGKYCEIHLRRSFLRHASYGGSRTRPQLPG